MARIPDAKLPAGLAPAMQNNLQRALYNNPSMAEDFGVLAKAVHASSHLDHRTRELAILRIAAMAGSEVEWAQHFKIAQQIGVSADEARAVHKNDLSAFAESERQAIRFAQAVEERWVTAELSHNTAEHFSETEMLDLIMLAGFYGFASRTAMALGVEVDAGLNEFAAN